MIFELGNFGFLKRDNARSLFDKKRSKYGGSLKIK